MKSELTPWSDSRVARFHTLRADIDRLIDEGKAVDRDRLIRANPEFAAKLSAHFKLIDWLNDLPLQVEQGEVMSTDSWQLQAVSSTDTYSREPNCETANDVFSLRPASATRCPLKTFAIGQHEYHVYERLHGGMGQVLLARHKSLDVEIALKTILDYDEWSSRHVEKHSWFRNAPTEERRVIYAYSVERFRREAHIWVQLRDHPHILKAWLVFEINAKPYIVLEYANSGDLDSWIEQGKIDVPLAVDFAIQFCDGMQHAVAQGKLVHRDIKPGNVLVVDNRIIKIADFGLARAFDDLPIGSAAKRGLRAAEMSLGPGGTRSYQAPEQFQGLGKADTRSDIFSFGVTLYEMLTSSRAFEDLSSNDAQHEKYVVPPAHIRNTAVPQALSIVVARCLEYEPDDRYQSFADLKEDLRELHNALPHRIPLSNSCTASANEESEEQVLESLVRSYEALGEHVRAVEYASQGLDLTPDSFGFWTNRGKQFGEMGEYSEAERCFRRALEVGADTARETARAWTNLSYALSLQGNVRDGLDAARYAAKADSSFSLAWMVLGSCQRRANRLGDAVASLREATELAPADYKAWANLGFCYEDLEQFDKALSALSQAVTLNPENSNIWYHIAQIHASDEDWKQARGAIDRCLDIDRDNPDAWALRCLVFGYGNQDIVSARRCAAEALAIEPDHDKTRVALAGVLADQGWRLKDDERFEKALELFKEATRLKPQDPKFWFEVAWISSMQDNWSEARVAISRCRQLDSDNQGAIELESVINQFVK